MKLHKNTTRCPYFVEYIDNATGIVSSEEFSAETLNRELTAGEITITHIELAYWAQVKLGLIEDE